MSLKRLNNTLPRKALLTLYKYFVKSHLYYEDIIYDKQNNKSFCDKRETVQYNAALDLTSSILGTSKVKLYKKLGPESIKSIRYSLHVYLAGIFFIGLSSYLYNTRNSENVATYHCRTDTFKYSFFPWTFLKCIKLYLTLHKSSYEIFRNYFLKLICQLLCMTFAIN